MEQLLSKVASKAKELARDLTHGAWRNIALLAGTAFIFYLIIIIIWDWSHGAAAGVVLVVFETGLEGAA